MLDKAVSNLTTLTTPDLQINGFGNSLEEEEEEEDKDEDKDKDNTPTEDSATVGTKSAATALSPGYTAKLAVAQEDPDLEPDFIDASKIGQEAKGTGKVNSFILALGIYAPSMDISALVDLFNYVMLEPLVVKQFPKSRSTLKKYMRSVLPLQTIKAHHFRPDTDQLPPETQTPSNAYYFNIKEIASIWLSDKTISGLLYTGLGEFVDEFQENWQADAWLETIQTSSREFA